ncbi:Aste57867_15873 [Aphanomyces stellatus]|uniref:Aste57867_15873 protein n=1 Tax=Aphanomyces stellatus TaxID=120398 RepID=A0A485L449_9STRA|nr:hypothetical protein As57867_015817 [Aphanomyces stellatus]VFT92660.1 Aste57867_15873 [Aphanomyces stellatus]
MCSTSRVQAYIVPIYDVASRRRRKRHFGAMVPLEAATPNQPLVLVTEMPSTAAPVHVPPPQAKLPKQRVVLPDQTSLLVLRAPQYKQALTLLPILYQFERKCEL